MVSVFFFSATASECSLRRNLFKSNAFIYFCQFQLESELNKLQAAHEALFASAERRESLERTARAKLSTELKRLTAVNRELLSSGSLQNLSPSPFSSNITPDIEFLKKKSPRGI